MGYGYFGTFTVIFLTHPGVVIPTVSSVIGKATSFVPPQFSSLVPSGGIPITITALWQVFCAWVLSLPGQRSEGFGWTMVIIYWVFLFLYLYVGGSVRLSSGI